MTRDVASRGPARETIYHLTRDGTPALPGDEGFVHASFRSQLAGTLAVHFAGAAHVELLRLDPRALGARLVVEPSRGGRMFPHIYGEIEPADVVSRHPLARDAHGAFDLSGLP